MEVATGDNVHADDSVVVAEVGLKNLPLLARRSNSSMVKISLFGLSVLPLRRTLAETTRAVRPLLLFVAVIVAITYTRFLISGCKVT